MIKLGLIGYPLGHSLSPKIHSAALKACDLEGSYFLFPIHPNDKQGLKALLERVRSGEITGLNVTIPHKQNVIEFLDELTPTAAAIGAVNTIYLRNDKLVGDNTDSQGFSADLKRFLTAVPYWDDKILRHRDLTALILGAGGGSRAVIYALLNADWDVTIAARRLEQAKQLETFFLQQKLQITNCELSDIDLSNISLIVNTTPLGMIPDVDKTPWPKKFPFPHQAFIYDLVYNPHETKLVRDARYQGLQATTGLGMLIEQAALSFEIWTAQTPSREIMRLSIQQSLVSNYQLPITHPGSD